MGMRHLQRGGINDHIINGDDVDVHQTVDVAPIGIAVSGATQAALNVMDAFKHLLRLNITGQFHTQIEETVIALKPPRLTLHDR